MRHDEHSRYWSTLQHRTTNIYDPAKLRLLHTGLQTATSGPAAQRRAKLHRSGKAKFFFRAIDFVHEAPSRGIQVCRTHPSPRGS